MALIAEKVNVSELKVVGIAREFAPSFSQNGAGGWDGNPLPASAVIVSDGSQTVALCLGRLYSVPSDAEIESAGGLTGMGIRYCEWYRNYALDR